MNRSGYCEEIDDNLELGRWRAQVASAIRGKRGQRLLLDLIQYMEAMPDKRIVREALKDDQGQMCLIGCALAARGAEFPENVDDYTDASFKLNVATQMIQEMFYINDQCVDRWVGGDFFEVVPGVKHWLHVTYIPVTDEERYQHVLDWCRANLKCTV